MALSDEKIQVKPRKRRVGKVGGDVLCCQSMQSSLAGEEAVEIASLLRALADPTRVQIVTLLADHPGEVCVCDITSNFTLDQSTISHHLRLLREAGIIDSDKHGVWSYYFLQPGALHSVSRFLQLLERHE